MLLKQFQQILKTDNIVEQMTILGQDISKLSVKTMNAIIKKELSFDYQPKYTKWFKKDGRKFKVSLDIEDLNAGEYSYFKQILGDINSEKIVKTNLETYIKQDNIKDAEEEIVEKTDEEKANLIFNNAHKLISVFLIEKTWFKKHLSFQQKQEMLLNSECSEIIPLVFFFLIQINNLQKNTTTFYINQLTNQSLKEEV